MLRRFGILLVAGGMLLLPGCRTPEAPPEEPVALLHHQPKLPRRGLSVSDFERLANWKVFSESGEVELSKELSQVLWGRASALIQLEPEIPGRQQVVLTPAEPWVIPSPFDTILLWMRHKGESGLRKDHLIRLHYVDAKGNHGEWDLPYTPSDEVQMLHLRVPGRVPTPLQVKSLSWELPGNSARTQQLQLDSLSIYQEVLGSLPQNVHYVRPHGYAPAYAPQRKNSVSLNFPDGPFAYRPQTRGDKFIQKLEPHPEGGHQFVFKSRDLQLVYRIQSAPGMPSVELQLNGHSLPGIWQGAEVMTEEGLPEFRFARSSDGLLFLQYTQGVEFEFSLHGKTLQMEMSSLLENVHYFDLGRLFTPDGDVPDMLRVPFMRIREDLPWPVFQMPSPDGEMLLSCFPDWWSSLSSRFQPGDASDRMGTPLGKMLYEPRWRGNRNRFRERIYFTLSDKLEDVLPRPSMPQALYRQPAGEKPWHDAEPLQEQVLMSIEPLDPEWEDRLLSRDGQGEWRMHPDQGVLIKPGLFDGIPMRKLRALEPEAEGAWLFLPSTGRFPPWRYMDYDVRSVGGAGYTQAFAETAALLQQVEAEWGGGVVTYGGAEWFWSGLVSGFLSEFPLGIMELHPLLPQFAWETVHPASQILGLGELEDFRLPTDVEWSEEQLLDRLLAFQVAYAAMGRIPLVTSSHLQMKSKALQETLQPYFAGTKVERIAYADGNGFVDAGEALRSGALLRSQLYVRLDSHTEIWVNGDLFSDWQLRVDGEDLQLPPFGFVVRGDDTRVINLPRGEGRPGLFLLQAPDRSVVISPEKKVDALSMQLQGCVSMRKTDAGGMVFDLAAWQGQLAVSNQLLPLKKTEGLQGITGSEAVAADLRIRQEGGAWLLRSDEMLQQIHIPAAALKDH